MADITQARNTLIARVLEGDGRASRDLRRAAFANAGLGQPLRTLIDKVAQCAYAVTDEDIAAVGASGLSETKYLSSSCVRPLARQRGNTTRHSLR
jgi:hypothetical protein